MAWLQWHLRSWRDARDAITRPWGHHPSASITARAVAGVRAGATRPVLGRVLRWRSTAEVSAMHALVGKRLDPWSRRRRGRPRLR